jgi:SAM-dependent methyltransferase
VPDGSEPNRPRADRLGLRTRFHPESRFGGFTDLDGTIPFYARVQELLSPDAVALDVGCGRGTQADDPVRVRRDLRILKGKCKRVIGIDVDPVAAENPFVDEFRMIDGDRWPVDDASIDVALADFVLEHVPDPAAFFAEAERVVKPGGHVCIRTINANSYVGMASRLVPQRLHVGVVGHAHHEREAQDVFPTLYRCNTRRRLAQALDAHGFDAAVYGSEDEPGYLTFNSLAYRLGLAHRRLAPKAVRVGLLAWGRRR